MLKKISLIFVCLFFLTGCDVTYDLSIDNDGIFKEKVTLPVLKQDISFDSLTSYLTNKLPISISASEDEYYNAKIYNGDNYYELIYDYDYNLTNVSNAYFIKLCFPNASIINDEDQISVASGKGFKCTVVDENLFVDSAKINITTELEVLNNNADEVDGNTYIWNINNSNYLDKEINITLKKNTSSFWERINYKLLGIIIGGFLIGGLCLLMYYKNKKINNI